MSLEEGFSFTRGLHNPIGAVTAPICLIFYFAGGNTVE